MVFTTVRNLPIADCGWIRLRSPQVSDFGLRNGTAGCMIQDAGLRNLPSAEYERRFKKKPKPNNQHGLEKKIRAGRKPSSVSLIAQGDDHLSGPPVARQHERPTRKSRTGRPYPLTGDASLCGLAPGGVFQAPGFAAGPGGLLPHRFTLTLAGGLLFCGTVHGVAPCPVSGPPCPAELGLSSPRFRGAITSPALIVRFN